jgi:hypothetical protein
VEVKAGKPLVVQDDVQHYQQIGKYQSNKKLDKGDENRVAITLKVSKFFRGST